MTNDKAADRSRDCWCVWMCAGLCLRDASTKSHFPIQTPPGQRVVGTVALSHPVRRTVFRCSESEVRTLEATVIPLRADHMDTNHQTCLRDMVSIHIPLVLLCDFYEKYTRLSYLLIDYYYRAKNNSTGPSVLPSHTDGGQHLARSSNTSVWSHNPTITRNEMKLKWTP